MKIAPSILAADLGALRAAVVTCEAGGAELVHVDVMDGHFVPNLSFGPPVIEAIRRFTEAPFDIHLMVENPEALLDSYLAVAPRWLSVHWESTVHLDRLAQRVRDAGVEFGVALNPTTPVEPLAGLLPLFDFVLLMSVNPGFAGQSFIPYVLNKAERLRELIDADAASTLIEMDGGISGRNLRAVRKAGVDMAVIGSGIFAADDPLATLADLIAQGRENT